MEYSRPRGRSFLEEETPPSPSSSSNSQDDGDSQDGPVMYDPTLVFDDDDDNMLDDIDDDNTGTTDNTENENTNTDKSNDEEDEEEHYSRGRSRSRSVHGNDDVTEEGKRKGLSEKELTARIEEAAKNSEKDRRVVIRTGALKQREVTALETGLREASHQTKDEERLEEEAEKEAALREKEERSVSISNTVGRNSLLGVVSPPGVDPPMRRVKILLLGDSSVGKSSLIHRLTDNSFKQSMVATVGVDYKVRKLQVNGENVQVQLWDTAGSEKFHKITQSYYRGVHGIMLVYDVSNRKSFKHVSYWLSNISKNANENVQVLLVGNKVDLRLETKKDPNAPSKINKFIKRGNKNSAEVEGGGETVEAEKDPFVQTYEGSNVASRYHISHSETSALSNTNIEESLVQCVRMVIHNIDNPTLLHSLRDRLKRGNSTDSKAGRLNSTEAKVEKADPASPNAKEKDCVIS